jgi:hypothetical protein
MAPCSMALVGQGCGDWDGENICILCEFDGELHFFCWLKVAGCCKTYDHWYRNIKYIPRVSREFPRIRGGSA